MNSECNSVFSIVAMAILYFLLGVILSVIIYLICSIEHERFKKPGKKESYEEIMPEDSDN